MDLEDVTKIAVDCGFYVHKNLGPGLLESAYETVLAHILTSRGLAVERQKPIAIHLDGLFIKEGFKADLIVEGKLLIELKAVERLLPVHAKQVQTYLRFLDMPVGLLMNFSNETFKEGLRRILNKYNGPIDFAQRHH